MSNHFEEPLVDRRQFLRAATLTAAAAAVTGTAAAVILSEQPPAPINVAPAPVAQPVQSAVDTSHQVAELLAKLAASEAENIRLQAELQATERQVTADQTRSNTQDSAATEAWQLQLDQANSRVASLTNQVGILSGLLALYEQLEGIDLPAVIEGGLESVGDVLAEVSDELPTVSEGIDAGRQALDNFEAQIPAVESGRQWLAGQLENLELLQAGFERTLADAVEATGDLLQKLNAWFQDILKWLPFGLGDKAARVMESMADLIDETPKTIIGLENQIARPLDVWFERDEGEIQLRRYLIRPVREEALSRAAATMEKVHVVRHTYDQKLADPSKSLINRQRAIQDQIRQFRQTYQI